MSNLPKVSVSDLLDAGVHFGHKTSRWNPKMEPYIYGTKDNVHIIDLQQTVPLLQIALKKIYETPEATNSYVEPVRTFTTRTVYSGSLSYSFSRTSKIMIALFDEDNHMKKVYVNNETQREGEYTYNYQIGSDEMNDKKHYLRMFRDGRLAEEISIIPSQ